MVSAWPPLPGVCVTGHHKVLGVVHNKDIVNPSPILSNHGLQHWYALRKEHDHVEVF